MPTPNWYKTKTMQPRDESPMPPGLWTLTQNMEGGDGVRVDPEVMWARKDREAVGEEEKRTAAHTGVAPGNSAVPQNAGGIGVTFQGAERDSATLWGPASWMPLPTRDMTNRLPIPASGDDMGLPPCRSNTYKELGETVMSWLGTLTSKMEHGVPRLTQ